MLTTETIRITCQEKGRGDTFEADVAADCTANEIVRGLVEAGYLTGPTGEADYVLTNGRTGVAIPANMTLEAADVRDGEVLTVTKDHHGA